MPTHDFDAITPTTVQRAVDGDADAMREVLAALQPGLHSLALRMLADREDAADALQECLLRIVTRLSTYRGDAKFSTWAWTVAVRAFLDHRRGLARRARFTFDDFAADLEQDIDDHAATRVEDRVYLQQVKVGCGRALLQCLDGDHRLAYVLVEIMGFESVDAAAFCEVNGATFRKRLSRARARVREHLNASCGVVRSSARCRCQGRLGPARRLGRLDPDDGMDVSVEELTHLLDGAASVAAYFRYDREATLPAGVLDHVVATLRPG